MISIIIPAYREEKLLDSVLSRLTSLITIPHEIIVSDDKSPDNTAEIARKYTQKVLVPETKHRSIAANRNAGARLATGEILVFIDVDHFLENPDQFFTHAIEQFAKDPELVGLTGALWVLPEHETAADKIIYTIFNWVHVWKNNIFHTGEASGKFQMIRREAFLKVGGYREELVTREDADMFQRLAKIGRTRCDTTLKIFHTGRRAHQIGWPKLLWIWMFESAKFAAGVQTELKEWKDVR